MNCLGLVNSMIEKDYEGPAEEVVADIDKMLGKIEKYGWDALKNKSEYAIKIDRKCYPAYVYLGYYEHNMKNYEKMDEYFYKALELADKPSNVYTWDGVILTLDDAMKDYDRLVRYLQKFSEKHYEFFVVSYLSTTLWKKLNRTEEAIMLVNKYISSYPNDKKALKYRKKMMKKIKK